MAGKQDESTGTNTTPPLAEGNVGNRSQTGGPDLKVQLKILDKKGILEILAKFDDGQKFFVHHVEGSMVSLTVSPTRGGDD